MNALTFNLKKPLQFNVNCAPLNPSHMANLTLEEIAKIPLEYGNQLVATVDIFDIEGDDTQNIIFKNATSQLDYLGANMASGKLTIEGDAGSYLGYKLKQSEIICLGNTGDFAACLMQSGSITIYGNTGDFLGGATAGLRKGMRGGTVIVKGNAGDRVGDQMRRGLILIEGNAGSYCGSRMVAGTIGVLGKLGEYAGFNMKRGTLLVSYLPTLHATMQNCGTHTLPFLSLMFKSFAKLDTLFSKVETQRVQRYVGDASLQGNGEILLLLTKP
jgi:formylmethanofuran dehydrogenase subunit C